MEKEVREELIFIPLLLPSANKWNTMHFGAKQNMKTMNKDYLYMLVNKQIDDKVIEPFLGQVIMEFQPYVGKTTSNKKNAKSTRPFDKINYGPSIKYFEDILVRCDLIVDDSNDYVLQHTINETIVDRNIYGDGMIIVIKEVDKNYSKERQGYFYNEVLSKLDKVK